MTQKIIFGVAVLRKWRVKLLLGPLHTQDWDLVTITLQALSLVEKVEPVQVHFTLRLRDQRSMWMQDGCKSLHGFLHGIEWIMFQIHLDCFQKSPLAGRPNTKPGDRGTPNVRNRWFILFYHVWRPAWIKIHWNSIWLRARSHMSSHYTWGPVTTLHDIGGGLGTAFGHFLLGSHNFMVTALGSCVKWPLTFRAFSCNRSRAPCKTHSWGLIHTLA